jgi:hypothetical protein
MAIRENNQTRDIAAPVVIVAAIRSGGTFLAHCLSNHTSIFCDRGEPLHYRSVWCNALHPNRRHLLAALLNQTGYQVSMCKLTYMQALHRDIWPWLEAHRPRVIWLRRENHVRQAVSVLINKAARAGQLTRPQHTFAPTKPARVELAPALVLKAARGLSAVDRKAREQLRALGEMHSLTYADVVGGEHMSAERLPTWTGMKLCQFLRVPYERMKCDLKRVNPYPLREMLRNWREVETAVQASEFADYLEDELAWTS